MSATEYRPGDIAMVDGKPAVWVASRAGTYVWHYLNGAEPFGIEVGPVLGNVGDIATAGGIVRLRAVADALEARYAQGFTDAREDTKRKALAKIERDTSLLVYSDPLAASVAQRFRALIRKALT